MTPFIGQIMAAAFNFAPRGWSTCAGQLISIQQNQALFALLGTFYGGNGQTTFALPDLRSRVAVGIGQGQGLSPYNIGERAGVEAVTLTSQTVPQHFHQVNGSTNNASATAPTGNALGQTIIYANSGNFDTPMNAGIIGNYGGSQPHENRQPFLTINFVIALIGVFPSRN